MPLIIARSITALAKSVFGSPPSSISSERVCAIATKKRNPVRLRFLIYYMCDFLFESFLFYDDAFAVEVHWLEVYDNVCAVLFGLPLVGSHDVVVRLFVEPCA